MRHPEQRLWDALRKSRPADVFLERMENVVTEGRPDVDALHRVGKGFESLYTPIELKARDDAPVHAQTPALGNSRGLSIEQRNWHLNWARYGGRSLIIARIGRALFVIDGRRADDVNRMGTAALAAACLLKGAATPRRIMGEIITQTDWRV